MPRIDAHQHFWKYDPAAYPWIDDSMVPLRRDFLPADLRPSLDEQRIDGCVAVQAQASEGETEWLLDLADANDWIRGVVGWVDLAGARVFERLERLRLRRKLCGIRHAVQGEVDDRFLLRREIMNGIAALGYFGLTFDLLVVPRQLAAAAELAARFPTHRFVLDHLGKPEIRSRKMEPWRSLVRELAQNPNVHCKLSGMVTEADWGRWTAEDLRPYADAAIEAFGADRLMVGSDWPVCTVAAGYARVLTAADSLTAALAPRQKAAVFGGNAVKFYGLE